MSVLVQRLGLSSTGNRSKWTFSAWIKRSRTVPSSSEFFFSSNNERTSGGNYSSIMFQNDALHYYDYYSGSSQAVLRTNRKFRDLNAWYHIVVRYDTSQSTADDRIRFYVNGVQETSMELRTNPSSTSWESYFNTSGYDNFIGTQTNNLSGHFLGSMSHVHFSDGYSYDASTFGSTDSTTGEWKINTNPTFTLGTNGFSILKDGNTVTDQSSNSNDFSIGSGTLTKTEDCPSNVFATMNPLYKWDNVMNYSNGNTSLTGTGNNWQGSIATLGISSGKYYYEAKFTSATAMDNWYIGFNGLDDYNTSAPYRNGVKFYNYDGGEIYVGDTGTNGVTTANYGTFSNGDIIGIALDYDNETMSVYKNGSAIVTNYDYGSQTYSSTIKDGKTIAPCVSHYGSGSISFNFGNGYFGTTAVATNSGNGYQDADGNGIFNYTVPTNYRALCTKGLNQ
jgi:hypothetical protein|tara:strand:- start:974 stop:2320 length:1347 start_codon:yes stop_codon:yes gene_type:complete